MYGADLRADVTNFINSYGQVFTIKYLNLSGGSAYYDDDINYTISGTACYSGLFQSLSKNDNVLVEQGIINPSDKILFTAGDINISGTITIQAGSKTGDIFSIVPLGKGSTDLGTDAVYNKLYLRKLSTGSLLGEV